MTGREIIDAVKELDLPKDEYVVFGSCPLALAGLRESSDVDMLVSDKLLQKLASRGWKQVHKGKDYNPYTFGDFEAHNSWIFSSYSPTLEHLLETATWVEDIPLASLEEVRKWKVASCRPKDFKDIELIDAYLEKVI